MTDHNGDDIRPQDAPSHESESYKPENGPFEGYSERPNPPVNFQQRHADLIKKANGGRGTMLLVCILTFINIVLILINVGFSFPFSLSMPWLLPYFGSLVADEMGSGILSTLLILLPVVLLLVCYYMYKLSRKSTAPIIVFLVIIAVDTLLLLAYYAMFDMLAGAADLVFNLAVEVIFHAWAIFNIVSLLRTRLELDRLWAEEEGTGTAWSPASQVFPKKAKSKDGGEDPLDK